MGLYGARCLGFRSSMYIPILRVAASFLPTYLSIYTWAAARTWHRRRAIIPCHRTAVAHGAYHLIVAKHRCSRERGLRLLGGAVCPPTTRTSRSWARLASNLICDRWSRSS